MSNVPFDFKNVKNIQFTNSYKSAEARKIVGDSTYSYIYTLSMLVDFGDGNMVLVTAPYSKRVLNIAKGIFVIIPNEADFPGVTDFITQKLNGEQVKLCPETAYALPSLITEFSNNYLHKLIETQLASQYFQSINMGKICESIIMNETIPEKCVYASSQSTYLVNAVPALVYAAKLALPSETDEYHYTTYEMPF